MQTPAKKYDLRKRPFGILSSLKIIGVIKKRKDDVEIPRESIPLIERTLSLWSTYGDKPLAEERRDPVAHEPLTPLGAEDSLKTPPLGFLVLPLAAAGFMAKFKGLDLWARYPFV